jgi:hypothetical protein
MVDAQTIPLTILAGRASYNKISGHWTLAGPPSDETDRRFVAPILFERPFLTTPVVNLGLCGLDIENGDSARLRVRVEEITTNGFLVVAETWFNTQVHGFDVSWMAVGT